MNKFNLINYLPNNIGVEQSENKIILFSKKLILKKGVKMMIFPK
jgi:hypothetical protein